MSEPKQPIEVGEWVDPAVPLPDHPFRKTMWWGIFNRAPRPFLWWVTIVVWTWATAKGLATNSYPPEWLWFGLSVWTAGLFGVTTYEKRLGIA